MKKLFFLLFFIIPILAIGHNPILEEGAVIWNQESRTLAFSSHGNTPWLVGGTAQIRLASGPVVSTSDKRFDVTVSKNHSKWYISGKDSEKTINWEIVITPVDSFAVRIDMTIYNQCKLPLKLDRIDILDGKLTGAVEPDKNRCVTSGLHSWDGGNLVRLQHGTKIESYYTLAVQSPSLATGFLKGCHNLDRFSLIQESSELKFTAYGECNQCVLPSGAARCTDPLFISGGGHPLGQMELFADLAARENGVQLWPENFATWCSWYSGWMRPESIYEFKDGLQCGIGTNIPLISGLLSKRGTPSMRVVDDSNEMAYGDWDNRTLAISNGFSAIAQLINNAGIKAGVWYPPFWVSTKSRLFQEKPNLLCRNDDGQVAVGRKAMIPESMYGNHLAFLDASNPATEQQIQATARAWRDRGFRYIMTDFMYWGAWPQKRFDSTLTSVETYMQGLSAMRRGYGKDTYWLHCGALLGPAMGLCDGMRIGGDSHGDDIDSYKSAASRWFYNWKVWLNDPDAIVCRRYGEQKGVEWNRSWMSWMALAGTVMTYGDTFDDLPAEYIELYKRIFPPLPLQGRPVDIWENEPYLIWALDPGNADGPYTLFGVFEFLGGRQGQEIVLNLDEIAARARSWDRMPGESPAKWLLWDFWEQRLIKSQGPLLPIPVPSKSCRVFSLRPYLGRPQLLGTSGHFSQGSLETHDISWDDHAGILTGKVRGNGGDPTTLFIYLPEGMKCTRASVAYTSVIPKIIKPDVLALQVPATGEVPVRFELTFSGSTTKSLTRVFERGLAGEVKPAKVR